MKKTHSLLLLLITSSLASCNMQGHSLYAGDEEEQQPLGRQEQDNDIETISTTFSEAQQADYAILKGEGYTDNEAIRFVQELEKKVNEEKPEAWAASYSMAIVQGMTEEEAENFANGRHSNYASQRLQGGQKKKLLQQANVPRGVYYYLALEKHGENTALELSKVYEQ